MVEAADTKIGFNAATGAFEDMFAAGIIDPAKARPCTPLLVDLNVRCRAFEDMFAAAIIDPARAQPCLVMILTRVPSSYDEAATVMPAYASGMLPCCTYIWGLLPSGVSRP